MLSSNEFRWFVLAVLLVFVEIFTQSLFITWFIAGAIFAMIAAILGGSVLVQVIVFLASTALLLILTKPLAKKFSMKKVKTNADKAIGEKGIVIIKIDPIEGPGQVKVLGQVWTAVSSDNQIITEGEIVEVIEISGVKLIVKKSDAKE